MATLWWRDDDAVAPSRRLDDLLAIAGEVPVALAVIPALAQPALAARLCRPAQSAVRVLQHGWRHHNRAEGVKNGGKKSEFPPSRSPDETAADLADGHVRIKALFGPRALPVLAPPWNRFDDALLPLLASAGVKAVSQIKPRRAPWPAPGVFAANVHVDLVAWREGRGFVGEAAALGGIVGHLRARRRREADPDEPTGILTHHLVHDETTCVFLDRLLGLTREHPAARWLAAGEVFAAAFAGIEPAGRA